jgi:Baseplate J-like protein
MIASQLNCPNDARLAQLRALANPAHNAIDYLEVLPAQRLLAIHCIAELGPLTDPSTPALSADNVVIGGGVRVSAIKVLGAWRGDQVPTSVMNESLGPDATQILLVQTDSSGDFSTYRLMIVDSASDPALAPRAEFDPLLAAIDFSFKVDCPSDFDCARTPACPPVRALPQVDIDYLSKDYQSFYQLLINRLATTMPEWQERNGADVGVTLVELFSYIGDQLSYYQDAVATEAYLGTARQRVSVRRHARLLDYLMHDGINARAFVCMLPTTVADGATVPANTAITERDAQLGPGDHPLEQAVALGAVVFQTMHDVVVHASQNEIEFYTWGDPACCLPAGATTATLVGTAAELALQCGDVLIFQERLGPESGLPGDARIEQRCAVRLVADPVDATDPLPLLLGQAQAPTAVVNITWHADDALAFPLCLHDFNGTIASYARGNVVLADHGLTVDDGPIAATSTFSPTLARPSVTQAAPYSDALARARAGAVQPPLSAGAVLATDVRTALPSIAVNGEGVTWTPARDLLESGPFDAQFVAEVDDDDFATLRFGDGTLGRTPRAGEQYQAGYRIGNGTAGNVGPDTLTSVIAVNGVATADNPIAAAGGAAPEETGQVQLDAPVAFRTQQRAVTEADYVAVCKQFPGVQNAAATRRFTGSWYTMFLTVERTGGLDVDPEFEAGLLAFLDSYRLAGGDVEIESPQRVPLLIELQVCVADGYVAGDVESDLLDLFSDGVRANGTPGIFAAGNWTFGQTVYLSPLIAAAMDVPGVASVTPITFERWAGGDQGELQAGEIDLASLQIAQLSNDPTNPENGCLILDMEGGL